jgi:Uncharacterized protein conserved in bacteria
VKPFRWDPAKASVNWRKHRVAFAEAATVFFNDLARIHDDPDHSEGEMREIIVGHFDDWPFAPRSVCRAS